MRAGCFAAVFLPLVLASAGTTAESDERIARDEKTLKEAGLATDGPALLKYIAAQTPSQADLARLAQAAERLGHRSFAVREKAQQVLIAAGRPSLRFLQAIRHSSDI